MESEIFGLVRDEKVACSEVLLSNLLVLTGMEGLASALATFVTPQRPGNWARDADWKAWEAKWKPVMDAYMEALPHMDATTEKVITRLLKLRNE